MCRIVFSLVFVAALASVAFRAPDPTLSFLADLPQLNDVSLRMPETAFKYILEQRKLEYRNSAKREPVAYLVIIRGQHRDANVLFSFRDGLCCGIQRLQEDPAR